MIWKVLVSTDVKINKVLSYDFDKFPQRNLKRLSDLFSFETKQYFLNIFCEVNFD